MQNFTGESWDAGSSSSKRRRLSAAWTHDRDKTLL